MSKPSFKKSIFDVIEFLTNYELSHHARKLVIHYFNKSTGPTSYEKAVEAIEQYLQDKMPDEENCPERLTILLHEMKRRGDSWDYE